ncbi:hypothetical protein NPIL_683341, partial [Nephila pilipes]
MEWVSSQAADIFDAGVEKPFELYDKCLNKKGNYGEKDT